MRKIVHRHVPWPIKLLRHLLIVIATAYLSLVNFQVVNGNVGLTITAISAVALVTLASATTSIVRARTEADRWQMERDVREALIGLLFAVHDRTKTDVRDTNAIYLEVGWRLRWQRTQRRLLLPAVRAELGAHEPSRLDWTIGKGVVGRAWDIEKVQFRDIRALTDKWAGCSEEQWLNASADVRMGLSFHEWEMTQTKYGTVVACCVRDNGTITGVLAINGSMACDWTSHEKELTELVVVAAKTISTIVRRR